MSVINTNSCWVKLSPTETSDPVTIKNVESKYAVPDKAQTAAAIAATERVFVNALLFCPREKAMKISDPIVIAWAMLFMDLNAGVPQRRTSPVSPSSLGIAAPPVNIPTIKPSAVPTINREVTATQLIVLIVVIEQA